MATKVIRTPKLQENELEEARLLEAIATHDHEAFEQLHKRFSGVLYSTIYKVLNDDNDTKDVLQEVFAQIWKKADTYERKKGKPLTWAATMARNRAIDRLRSHQRRSRLNRDFRDESETKEKISSRDASDEVFDSEKKQIVRSAVMDLSAEQREAIELAFFGGLTQNEVAERLGKPVGTIKARIRRGVMSLRSTVPQKV
ncbi:MAG: sigma-70 family RNA polymerase sigma factor [Verrucomicrobiota bacterium]